MGPRVLKVLDVSPRPVHPPRRGADVRTASLLEPLAERHDVRGFSLVGRERPPAGLAPYPEVRVDRPASRAVLASLERTWVRTPMLAGVAVRVAGGRALDAELARCEVCLVEFPWLVARCRPRVPAGRLVLCAHNVEADKFPSWAAAAGRPPGSGAVCRWVARTERRAAGLVDLVVTVSEADAERFRVLYGLAEERLLAVPNAVDTERLRPTGEAARAAARARLGLGPGPLAVFVGTRAAHNLPAAAWLDRLAAAAPGWTVAAVGRLGDLAAAGSAVLTPGEVGDVAPWLAAADVALCPIRHGGGTKLKLIEAWAAGLPVLGFEESLTGTRGRAGEHMEVCAPTDASLLAGLRRLEDADRRAALGAAGRVLAERDHSARAAAGVLERALEALVAPGAGSAARTSPARPRG